MTHPALHRLFRLLTAPFRFARRRPVRAGAAVLCLLLLAAAGGYAWFLSSLSAARLESDRGHHGTAGRKLRACQKVWPDHPDVLLLAARIARRSGAWDDADALLDRYAQRHGDDNQLAWERVLLKVVRGELNALSVPMAARLASGGPEATDVREAMAAGLLYQFRQGELETLLNEWLAERPDALPALMVRGRLHEQRQEMTRAIETYSRVVEADPAHEEARLRLAAAYVGIRRGDSALPHLEYLRPLMPDNPAVAVQLVRALALAGRPDDARAALAGFARMFPDHPGVLLEQGRQAADDGNDAVAVDLLARGLAADPGDQPAWAQLVTVLRRAGRADEAAAVQARLDRMDADGKELNALIEGPLRTRPDDPALLQKIGAIALRSGHPADAVRWFRAALAVDPNHAPTHRSLATLYQQAGDTVLSARHRGLAGR